MNAGGQIFLSHTKLRGAYALRVAIGHARTTEAHLAMAWQLIRETAAPDVLTAGQLATPARELLEIHVMRRVLILRVCASPCCARRGTASADILLTPFAGVSFLDENNDKLVLRRGDCRSAA